MNLNFEHLHLFIQGMKNSREQHAEEKQSYEFGLNGRLYSNNGKLAFSSIKGTLPIYNNPNIIKYLGYFSFADELVLFVKYDTSNDGRNINTNVVSSINSPDITLTIPFGSSQITLTDELTANATETINTVITEDSPTPEDPIDDNYTSGQNNNTIDLSNFYTLSGNNTLNAGICQIANSPVIPEYNKDYADAIIVLKNDGYAAFHERIAWIGYMNWDINRKITTAGVNENMYYKRVYFTDALNPLRVVNINDKLLEFRRPAEFDIKQNADMLQPEIIAIEDNGGITAMAVQYAYRLISENGQVTTFSPYSEVLYIPKESEGYEFSGGAPAQSTSKSVRIQIPILSTNYYEVQAIAIEFETDATPTAIRDLGKFPVEEIVEFRHNGNESELLDVSLEQITETRNIWTYCNDITAKNNILIAGGLRNEPYGIQEKYIEDQFLFKGYSDTGSSHDTLINEYPEFYRYIDATNGEKVLYVNKQLYLRFLFFGNVTLTLRNKKEPNADVSITFESSSDQYIDYIEDIWEWLQELDLTLFPNLQITKINNSILFSRIDELVQTDLADYYFDVSISQAIIDFDTEYDVVEPTVDTNNLVYGAQSAGFTQGVGIQMTFREAKEVVLNKSPELYESGPILDLEAPTLKKTFVKDEIYRIGIQFYKGGNPLFVIVCGDIKTPKIGEQMRYLDSAGQPVISDDLYVNQSKDGNQLYAHRLEAFIQVRVPCEFKNYVDAYQIMYVERTENNRTVLAQGISAPLVRLVDKAHPSQDLRFWAPNVASKWTLPFNGGPIYAVQKGFAAYDDPDKGENFNDQDNPYGPLVPTNDPDEARAYIREITNRRMFYFDSPDIIYGRISASKIKNGDIHVIQRVNSDATVELTRSRAGDDETHPNYRSNGEIQEYQAAAFSKKIGYSNLAGDENSKPYVVNISIFSEPTHVNKIVGIEKATDLLNKGEIVPGAALNSVFEISNMALSLFAQGAYNDAYWRSGIHKIDEDYNVRWHKSGQESHGYPTVFIRGTEDVFTDAIIGPQATNPIQTTITTDDGEIYNVDFDGTKEGKTQPGSDSHLIINIKLNNSNSIYGGRNKYAFSKNKYIPLSKVIPIKGSEANNQYQEFQIQGDFYCTLYLRAKNDYSELLEIARRTLTWEGRIPEELKDYNRGAAWAYGVILETAVEPRLNHNYQFYRSDGAIDFSLSLNEFLNSAYYKQNNLRTFIPAPYEFKDDPLLINILSASETKFSGDYIDAWTRFLINEFYELDLNKGAITNVTNWKDEIFAIQEHETNRIMIDTTDFITTQEGEEVAVKKGDGGTFKTHKKLSDFGTSIRRALAEGEVGFSFFDERKKSFVKFGESLSLKFEIEQQLHELFDADNIIDTEGYWDTLYEETNIRIRTEKGKSYLISFNELLGLFNGFYEYNHDIYIMFDNRVFVPCCALENFIIYCPQIFSANTITTQVNTYFEYQIEATENPIWFNAADLPIGVNINHETGLIYGSIATAGVYNIRANAENTECSDTLEIIVTVNAAKLEAKGTDNGVNGKATVTGTLIGYAPIEGTSDGSATVTGTLTKARAQISGTSDGSSSVSGTLSGWGYMVGVSNGETELIAELRKDLYGRINASSEVVGTVRQPFAFNDYIVTLEATTDCQLIVRGNFTIYGEVDDPQAALKLAKISPDGYIDPVFQTNIGSSIPDVVYSHMGAYVAEDNSIYITGYFNAFNGTSANYIVKLNPDGTKVAEFNYGSGFSWFTTIPYVKESTTRGVYIPGIYNRYKDVWQPRFSKIWNDGNVDWTFRSALGSGFNNTTIEAVSFDQDHLLIHGYFRSFNGNTSVQHLAVVHKDTGARLTSFNAGTAGNVEGNFPMYVIMDTQNGNKPILTGFFTAFNGDSSIGDYIVRLNRDGSIDKTYDNGSGFNATYNGNVLPPDYSKLLGVHYDSILGKAVIGGHFDTYNGQSVPPMVRLNADGSLDTTFNYTLGDIGYIKAIEEVGGLYFAIVDLKNEYRYDNVTHYLVKVEKDGNANVVMNLDGDPEVICDAITAGYSNAEAEVSGDLTYQIQVLPCTIIVGADQGMEIYNAETLARLPIPLPQFTTTYDIAHTNDKFFNLKKPVWIINGGDYDSVTTIQEYDIVLDPWSAIWNRDIVIDDNENFGPCLFAIDNTTLITSRNQYYINIIAPARIGILDISQTPPVFTDQFNLRFTQGVLQERVAGDLVLTNNEKLIVLTLNYTFSERWISQYDWNTGVLEVAIEVSSLLPEPYGLAVQNGKLYVFDYSDDVYEVQLTWPYTLTKTDDLVGLSVNGASQRPECINISFERTVGELISAPETLEITVEGVLTIVSVPGPLAGVIGGFQVESLIPIKEQLVADANTVYMDSINDDWGHVFLGTVSGSFTTIVVWLSANQPLTGTLYVELYEYDTVNNQWGNFIAGSTENLDKSLVPVGSSEPFTFTFPERDLTGDNWMLNIYGTMNAGEILYVDYTDTAPVLDEFMWTYNGKVEYTDAAWKYQIGNTETYISNATVVEGNLTNRVVLNVESIIVNDANLYLYEPEINKETILPVPNMFSGNDVAHTQNKLWIVGDASVGATEIWEWDITLNSWSANFNRIITVPYYHGLGLQAIDDTTLICTEIPNGNISSGAVKIYSVDITNETPVSTLKFNLDWKNQEWHQITAGDYVLTNHAEPKFIILVENKLYQNRTYLYQYDWNTGVQEIKIDISQIGRPFGLAVNNDVLYLFNANTNTEVYTVDLNYPYTLTYQHSISNVWTAGASQLPSAITTKLVPALDARYFIEHDTLGKATVQGNLIERPGKIEGVSEPESTSIEYLGPSGGAYDHSAYRPEGYGVRVSNFNGRLLNVEFSFKRYGSPDFDIVAKVYSIDGSGLPLSVLETSTNTIDASLVGTSYEWTKFNFTNTLYTEDIAIVLHLENVVKNDVNGQIRYERQYNNDFTNDLQPVVKQTTWFLHYREVLIKVNKSGRTYGTLTTV